MYCNQREKTKNTFQGPWTKSGDKYSFDADGYYTYGGRSDDIGPRGEGGLSYSLDPAE